LRSAQADEAAAVAAVQAAVIAGEKARARFDAAVAVHQAAVDDAAAVLTHAYADLVAVSGIDRAATILDVPRTMLKTAALSTTKGLPHVKQVVRNGPAAHTSTDPAVDLAS
jgi:hypothetical protein